MAEQYNKDLFSDRGLLPKMFEVVPFTFSYVAASGMFAPQQTQILLMNTGIGDSSGDDLLYNFQTGQNKDASLTSLWKGGFLARDAWYTLTGFGVEILSGARTVVLDSAGKVNLADAGTTLAVQENTQALTEALWRSVADLARTQYVEDDQTCALYTGNLTEFPASFGLNYANLGPSNGLPVRGNVGYFARRIVTTPQSMNGVGQNIQIILNHNGLVPRDPTFAAPADGSDIALFARFIYHGYLSDQNGDPLGEAMDPAGYLEYTKFRQSGGRCY